MSCREIQYPPVWVLVLFASLSILMGAVLTVTSDQPHMALLALTPWIPLALVGRQVTEIGAEGIYIEFGWIPVYRRLIPLPSILRAEAVVYDPIREYGGWGLRGRHGDRVVSQRGNRALRLQVDGDGQLTLGSAAPDRLLEVLRQHWRERS